MNIKKYFLIILNYYAITQNNPQIIKEVSALEFGKLNPQAQILQCTKDYAFNFKTYPLYPEQADKRFPNIGLYQDIYIVSVPHGIAHFCSCNNFWGINGLIFINNYFIKECQIKDISPFYLHKTNTIQIDFAPDNYYVKGSVAICSHLYPDCYGHFMLDILCQLALLEIYNIEYDYLCIPYKQKFMVEALELWGIEKQKIIPLEFNRTIQADTIIIPTSVTQTQIYAPNANYTVDFLIHYVSKKILNNGLKINTQFKKSSKIFISRKDANNKRFVPNEDEIFELFAKQGFHRYELTKLSLAEQILLFHNASEIVSFAGSGALNIIFSQPNTKYIEIVQTMLDATFFFLTNIFDIDYNCLNTTNHVDIENSHPGTKGKVIDLKLVQNFLKNY